MVGDKGILTMTGGNGETVNRRMGEKINSYKDLRVFQNAMDAAMKIFHLTKQFPPEEKYSMVDQIRRSSRSVCTNLAEACETQVWVEFARRCEYLNDETCDELDAVYEQIMASTHRFSIQEVKNVRSCLDHI